MSITNKLAPALTQKTIDEAFLTGPGEMIVFQTIKALSKLAGFQKIFGKVVLDPKAVQTNNRIEGYNRLDWTIAQLPAMNIFTGDLEDKSSDNGWVTGTVTFAVYWPPKFRRSDLTDVPLAFKGAMQNFFASQFVGAMMDRHVKLRTDVTVPGLNEYGKQMSWTPNTEGFLENDRVPVTILKVRYRLDLRAWYKELEAQGRTKADPFEITLDKYLGASGNILGVDDAGTVEVEVPISNVPNETP